MSKFELPISDNYSTEIGYSEVYKRNVYQIRNRYTDVIEFETPMYGTLRAVFDVVEQSEDEDEDVSFSNEADIVDLNDYSSSSSTH